MIQIGIDGTDITASPAGIDLKAELRAALDEQIEALEAVRYAAHDCLQGKISHAEYGERMRRLSAAEVWVVQARKELAKQNIADALRILGADNATA